MHSLHLQVMFVTMVLIRWSYLPQDLDLEIFIPFHFFLLVLEIIKSAEL